MSALLGGIAQGFVQGMDRRAAREESALERASKIAEAEKDRDLKRQQIGIQEEQLKEQIAQRKYTQHLGIANNAMTRIREVASKSGRLTSFNSLSAAEQQAFKAVGIPIPSDGMLGKAGQGIFQVGNHKALAGQILQGKHPFPLDNDPNRNGVVEQLVNITGEKNVVKLKQTIAKKYNQKQNEKLAVNISNRNKANRPDQTGYTFVQARDKFGQLVSSPDAIVKVPYNPIAYFLNSGLAKTEDEAKRLANMGEGREEYLALARLSFWNNELTEAESAENKIKANNAHWYIKTKLKDDYLNIANAAKRGFIKIDSPTSIGSKEFIYQQFNFPKIRDIFRLDPTVNKVFSDVLEEKMNPDRILQSILKSGLTQFKNKNEIYSAMDAGLVKFEIVDRQGTPPTAQTNTDSKLAIDRGRPKDKMLKVTLFPESDTFFSDEAPESVHDLRSIIIPITASFNGGQVRISSSETLSDNPKFEQAIALGFHAEHDPNYFNTKISKNPKLSSDFERYRKAGLYRVLKATFNNPTDKNVNELRDIIEANFDFSNSNILDKEKAMDAAVVNAIDAHLIYGASTKQKTFTRNGKTVRVSTAVQKRTGDQLTQADKKLETSLISQAQKLSVVQGQIDLYDVDLEKLSALREAAITSDPATFHKIMDLIESDKRFSLDDPETLRVMGVNVSNLSNAKQYINQIRRQGREAAGDYSQKKNSIFQAFADILTAGREGIQTLGLKLLDIGTLQTEAFKNRGISYRGRYNSFTSGRPEEADKDYLTRNALESVERKASQARDTFNTNMTKLKRAEQAAVTEGNKERLAQIRADMVREYLQARLASTRISLTYYFAGLVQGESGGRAISNEDFQVLFRALWQGGRAGTQAIAGASVMKDIVAGILEKNKLSTKYLGVGKGQQLANKAYKIKSVLDRRRYKNFEGKTLFSQIGRPVATLDRTTDISAPLVTGFDKSQGSSLYGRQDWRRGYASTINPLLPALTDNNSVRDVSNNFQTPWASLSGEEKKKISKPLLLRLESSMEANTGNNFNNPVLALNAFQGSTENAQLGDALKAFIAHGKGNVEEQALAYQAGQDANLQNDALKFVEFIYNQVRKSKGIK